MFSFAHLVKGVGPSDLYLRSKSFLYLPPVYRPEMVVTANSIQLKFPGTSQPVSYTDPNDPGLTFIAQRYRPLSLLYVLDLTTGECEASDFVPTRCEDFAAYITWFFSLFVGDPKYPPRLNASTFGVRYDGVYPYTGAPSSSDLVVDTACYGIRSRCFTAKVDDILLTELLRELQYFWCYASLRVGNLSTSFLHRAVSEVSPIPAFRCENRFRGSPVLAVGGLSQSGTPIHSKKVPRIVYDSTKFSCSNTPAIEPLQLRRETNCKCERVFTSPYLRATLIPIGCPPNMMFDPSDGTCIPRPDTTNLPPGYSVDTPDLPIAAANLFWGLTTWTEDKPFNAPVSLLGTKSCPTTPLRSGVNEPNRCTSYDVASTITNVSQRVDSPPRTITGLCGKPIYDSAQGSFAVGFFRGGILCTSLGGNYYYSDNRCILPDGIDFNRGGYCLAMLRSNGSGGFSAARTFTGFTPPPTLVNDNRPTDGCFLTTNSLKATIFKLRSGNITSTFSITVTAPPLCESYTAQSVLDTMALKLQQYMTVLGQDFQLGPFSFTSTKGASCSCS